MIFCSAHITTHGKWILAGEHAVIRGSGAIVFPLPEKALSLSYNPTPYPAIYQSHLLKNVFDYALTLLNLPPSFITGEFSFDTNIPIRAGLGGSAALSVAVARWFHIQNIIEEATIFHFARSLEDLFHGKSSGVDIAGAQSESPIYYQNSEIMTLHPTWYPQWYLSYSGQTGSTTTCIANVLDLWTNNKPLAIDIDKQMHQAVVDCKNALTSTESNTRLLALQQAIQKAFNCFEQWGLLTSALSHHINLLKEKGALAVKPTGSGLGGYVLSLWDKPPQSLMGFIPMSAL